MTLTLGLTVWPEYTVACPAMLRLSGGLFGAVIGTTVNWLLASLVITLLPDV